MKKPTPTQKLQEALETSRLLKERIQTEVDSYRRLRDKFTCVLKGASTSDFFPSRSDPYSWEEIFCEVGKLLVLNRNRRWEDNVTDELRRLWNSVGSLQTK